MKIEIKPDPSDAERAAILAALELEREPQPDVEIQDDDLLGEGESALSAGPEAVAATELQARRRRSETT